VAVGLKKGERRNISLNRRARFQYELDDFLEAGLVLLGSEVKSARAGKVTLEEAWVKVEDSGPPVLMGAHIAPYAQANRNNHEPTRPRTLLVSTQELRKLRQKVREKGLTVVPVQMYFCGPWAKIEIALGRGKKLHDKRQSLRAAEDRRETHRAVRG
jgi:SsrA-binding protein